MRIKVTHKDGLTHVENAETGEPFQVVSVAFERESIDANAVLVLSLIDCPEQPIEIDADIDQVGPTN